MEISVKSKYLKISPRKLRLAVNLVRNKNLPDAKNLLRLTNNKGAKLTECLLDSAIAIVKDSEFEVGQFTVSEIFCSDGPRLKRGKPASKGAMMPITKRQSHLYLTVSNSPKNNQPKKQMASNNINKGEKEKNGSKS
jgi:large subunit ribosomal protein L22